MYMTLHGLHADSQRGPSASGSAERSDAARASVSLSGKHASLREGTSLGLVVATATWVWVALVDVIAGQPFRTFTVLGGIASFTVMHYLLNVAYGVVIVSLIHGAVRQPSLLFAVGFGFLMMEFAFAMVTVMLSHLLGELAWLRIFVGSLVGAAIAANHPLAKASARGTAAASRRRDVRVLG
jgi:hypothetical protein